jgi:hypothetical protein
MSRLSPRGHRGDMKEPEPRHTRRHASSRLALTATVTGLLGQLLSISRQSRTRQRGRCEGSATGFGLLAVVLKCS